MLLCPSTSFDTLYLTAQGFEINHCELGVHSCVVIMADIQKSSMPRKLWQHPHPERTQMWQFMQEVNKKSGRDLKVIEVLIASLFYTLSICPMH